ncbi:hypothetical protein PVK06_022167 [Gossypium arboreum]|uniref:Uncharacterized protein n=1 Tax=Gossypium arboreum TaxID=29729 RepID=A0ABR0P7U5_GOSAR|nr:hypothetical protein PVK06_022167 [Gossypium arboreum]
MWITWKYRLLTNVERMRRHMSNESQCSRCGNVYELEIHAVRDCFFLKSIWRSVVPTHARISFFAMSMNDWMLWNLENIGDCGSRVVDGYSPMVTVAHWSEPFRGSIKLNIDGAISPNGSYAGIGGVFRDADANWL